MKFFIKIVAVAAAVMMLFTILPSASAAETYITLNGFAFDVNDDGYAVIHSYDDRSSDVSIPSSLLGYPVGEIADYAFFNDASLSSVSFEDATALYYIGANAFYGCTGLSGLTLPASAELGFGAFQGCSSVSELTIGDGITEIPSQCFYGCALLDEVIIPSSVGSIGSYAFGGCTGLTSVTIPRECESIASNAFGNCPNLTISCYTGSAAHQLAVDACISYILLDALPEEYLLGDSDGSDDVDVVDGTWLQRYVAYMNVSSIEATLMQGDIDRDKDISIVDAAYIMRYAVGVTTPYPIGEYVS